MPKFAIACFGLLLASVTCGSALHAQSSNWTWPTARPISMTAGGPTLATTQFGPSPTLTIAPGRRFLSPLPTILQAGVGIGCAVFHLKAGEQLTFLSDSVVEAQSAAGELCGFGRTAAISTHSAEKIAAAAQAFGQQDDSTVLTVRFARLEGTLG